jgi:signal transduction histidine kinase
MSEGQARGLLPDGKADVAVAGRERTASELFSDHEGLEQSVAEHIVNLAAQNGQLAAALKELKGFASSVSHDLRAPLRAIDGFSRILLEDYADRLDPEGQRVLNVVRDSTLKMSQLIDDILTFSRAACLEMKPERVDNAALVRQTLGDELAVSVAGRALPIEIRGLPDAHGDKAMLRRVWTNLLDNAIKFIAGKPDAHIEIGAQAGDGETIYYVRDTGAGFDMR